MTHFEKLLFDDDIVGDTSFLARKSEFFRFSALFSLFSCMKKKKKKEVSTCFSHDDIGGVHLPFFLGLLKAIYLELLT